MRVVDDQAEWAYGGEVRAQPVEAVQDRERGVDARRGRSIRRGRAGKPEQMTATLAVMLDNPKDFPQARLQVGDYYNKTGDREKALANYEAMRARACAICRAPISSDRLPL